MTCANLPLKWAERSRKGPETKCSGGPWSPMDSVRLSLFSNLCITYLSTSSFHPDLSLVSSSSSLVISGIS